MFPYIYIFKNGLDHVKLDGLLFTTSYFLLCCFRFCYCPTTLPMQDFEHHSLAVSSMTGGDNISRCVL